MVKYIFWNFLLDFIFLNLVKMQKPKKYNRVRIDKDIKLGILIWEPSAWKKGFLTFKK